MKGINNLASVFNRAHRRSASPVWLAIMLSLAAVLVFITNALADNTAPNQGASATQANSSSAAPLSSPAPLNLAAAWARALEHDPSYQAARSERDAGLTEPALGRAALLPQLSASAMRGRARGHLSLLGGAAGAQQRQRLSYPERLDEIRLSQTVFDWSKIAEARRGYVRADHANAVFDTETNNVSYRLINRYFQALLDYENLLLTESRWEANKQQLHAAERRYDAGEGTITDIREATARRDLSYADLVQAEDALILSVQELQEMVGRTPLRLFRLKDDFQTQELTPNSVEGWLALALAENPDIRVQENALQIAEFDVQSAVGQHLPSLEIVASAQKARGETVSTREQRTTMRAIGAQVNLPIYSGGRVQAQVRKARFLHEGAEHDLAASINEIEVEVTRQYQGIVGGTARIAALLEAVNSAEASLEAAQQSYYAGIRTLIDVLDAQDQLYDSQLQLARARLQYIVARLRLAGAAHQINSALLDSVTERYFGDSYIDLG